MNREEIKRIYNQKRPKTSYYVVILVAVLALVGMYYLVAGGAGAETFFGLEEGPPALPGTVNSPAVSDNPPTLPEENPPLFPR